MPAFTLVWALITDFSSGKSNSVECTQFSECTLQLHAEISVNSHWEAYPEGDPGSPSSGAGAGWKYITFSFQWFIQSFLFSSGNGSNPEERFSDLKAFAISVLGPQAVRLSDHKAAHAHLRTLAGKCPSVDANTGVQEWMAFKEHIISSALQVRHWELHYILLN